MQFLMGLNESFGHIRAQVLMMKPLHLMFLQIVQDVLRLGEIRSLVLILVWLDIQETSVTNWLFIHLDGSLSLRIQVFFPWKIKLHL